MARKKQTGVERVIAIAGTQSKVAADMGVEQQTVSHWLKTGHMPVKRAVEAEKLYGVPRSALVDPELRKAVAP
jgi:DNA-binding transcriptional regulator YdaS (Cro superfamily)